MSAPRAASVFDGHATGYRRADLINRAQGLRPSRVEHRRARGRRRDRAARAFLRRELLHLSGEAIVTIGGVSHRLRQGDYGTAKVGTPHSWRTAGTAAVRWLQMASPQPKPIGAERDTFFRRSNVPSDGATFDPDNRNGQLLGHFDVGMIPPPGQRTTAAAGLEGVFLKWLIDENFGASHHRLVFIEYQPGVSIALHDHTFEEGYFILSGEVEATGDGKKYRMKAGDVFWTSVGCVHSFAQVGSEPVRWLETFSPQPPKENVFRFVAEWEKKARELED
jgi:quercetin dioxygenase-like cupin family protein